MTEGSDDRQEPGITDRDVEEALYAIGARGRGVPEPAVWDPGHGDCRPVEDTPGDYEVRDERLRVGAKGAWMRDTGPLFRNYEVTADLGDGWYRVSTDETPGD